MRKLKQLQNLEGKTALVTGGAGYLGTAICEALAELGAGVIIASRDLNKCVKAAERLGLKFGGPKRFTAMALDILDKSAVKKCFEEMDRRYGGLDILVNNAWSGNKNSFDSIADEDWEYDIDMCLNAVFRCVKAAANGLKKKKGVIMNVASMYGHVAPDYRIYDGKQFVNPPSYGAAKAGVIQFTKYLASFLSPHEIRVNALSPGAFPHEITQENRKFMDKLAAKNPMGRIGAPEDLKGAVAFLCTDASCYVTGQNICVDGGWAVW